MMMSPETFERFHALLKRLRARGDRVDFPIMACAADLARAIDEGDRPVAENRARILGIAPEDLDRWVTPRPPLDP